MEVLKRISELKDWLSKNQNRSLGFVPTMGNLHEGHLSLLGRARKENDLSLISVFVNPKQFGEGEDFESYPRTFDQDLDKAKSRGCDAVFAPKASEIYPKDFSSLVQESSRTQKLCGLSREGHFDGVCTILSILFNLVRPNRCYFGMKDYQQLKVVEKLVQDLHFGCKVVGVETVREKDGLALSSRNQYLSEKGRKAAAVIFKGLSLAKASFDEGERDPEILKQLVRSEIDDHTEDVDSEVDYIEIYEAESLEDPEKGPPWVLAVAVFIEKSRLIDNIRLK